MASELTQSGAQRAIIAGMGGSVAAISTVYLALSTSLPGTPDTAALSDYDNYEITDASYARVSVSWSSPSGDPSKVSNSASVNFGPFAASVANITYSWLTDASAGSSGSVLAYWTLNTVKSPAAEESVSFPTGSLSMSLD